MNIVKTTKKIYLTPCLVETGVEFEEALLVATGQLLLQIDQLEMLGDEDTQDSSNTDYFYEF